MCVREQMMTLYRKPNTDTIQSDSYSSIQLLPGRVANQPESYENIL